jgi:hypothetical protein
VTISLIIIEIEPGREARVEGTNGNHRIISEVWIFRFRLS